MKLENECSEFPHCFGGIEIALVNSNMLSSFRLAMPPHSPSLLVRKRDAPQWDERRGITGSKPVSFSGDHRRGNPHG